MYQILSEFFRHLWQFYSGIYGSFTPAFIKSSAARRVICVFSFEKQAFLPFFQELLVSLQIRFSLGKRPIND